MLVLASASPRRREVFAALGIPVRIVPSQITESRLAAEVPEAFVARVARQKAEAVVERLERSGDPSWVLGADTEVVLDGEVLGKPIDRAHARQMLGRLSGRAHVVLTAWTLLRRGDAPREGLARATVRFRALSPHEIDRYVETGECDDKAGAYAIQGLGLWLVEHVEGSLPAVVCLPVAEVLAALREVGAIE